METSIRVPFVLIFAQSMECSSVCRLRLPKDHRRQPVTEPKRMSLVITHLKKNNQILKTMDKARDSQCPHGCFSFVENNPNAQNIFSPIRLSNPNSFGFSKKKLSLGIRSLYTSLKQIFIHKKSKFTGLLYFHWNFLH